jgi:phage terminase large subunit-like protein
MPVGSPTREEVQEWVAIEAERRRRVREREEVPKWDWFGPPCNCPGMGLDPASGEPFCHEHPRARPKQRPPDRDWLVWLILSGRGFGKTRTGAQWVIDCAKRLPSNGRFALVGQTASDVRDVMVEGDSGILRCSPPWFRPLYEPSKRRLTWPNGFQAFCYSSEEPGYFRGPQFHGAWCDEFAKWTYLDDCWDNLQFGLRLGSAEGWVPRVCITTTPLPLELIKSLRKDRSTAVVLGSTFENQANLAPSAVARLKAKYDGTRLGRQELYGEILEDTPGALWTSRSIDPCRRRLDQCPPFLRIAVSVDPSVGDATRKNRRRDEALAEAGIVVGATGEDEQFYVLEDATVKGHPILWGNAAVGAYNRHFADVLVAEINNGGKLIETLIQTIDDTVNYKEVTASRGKQTRAEPIASLYEQNKVHHVGNFPALEEEMTTWVPNAGMPSPNRVDALVWCLHELALGGVPIKVGGNPFPGWRG